MFVNITFLEYYHNQSDSLHIIILHLYEIKPRILFCTYIQLSCNELKSLLPIYYRHTLDDDEYRKFKGFLKY